MKSKTLLIASLAANALLPGFFSSGLYAASFQGLGDLPGGSFASFAYAVSADGKVVVGTSQSGNGYEAFRWTATNGMIGLGDLPGGSFDSDASGVSADGSVIVGSSSSTLATLEEEAFRWTQATGMVGLGDLSGGYSGSRAAAVSADGLVIVGDSGSSNGDEAFRWMVETGMIGLGDLPGGSFQSLAFAVSADGSVIVGQSHSSNSPSGGEAFRWTSAGGMVAMGDFTNGPFNSVAYGISPDGLVVVGRGHSGVEDPFRWTAATGLVHLGFLPCDTWTTAFAASADGSVIVGDPNQPTGDCSFIWDAQHGICNLHTVLTNDFGLNLTGWQLTHARAITPDGKTIVGYGTDPAGKTEAWIANLASPALGISRNATNVVLFWGTNTSGFVLEQTPDLTTSNLWNTNPITIQVSGSNFVATNIIGAGPRFFRLRKP